MANKDESVDVFCFESDTQNSWAECCESFPIPLLSLIYSSYCILVVLPLWAILWLILFALVIPHYYTWICIVVFCGLMIPFFICDECGVIYYQLRCSKWKYAIPQQHDAFVPRSYLFPV